MTPPYMVFPGDTEKKPETFLFTKNIKQKTGRSRLESFEIANIVGVNIHDTLIVYNSQMTA